MTTPERRSLRFDSLDDVLPEVQRLRAAGYRRGGGWSLAQACWHLATVMRRVVDLPASAHSDPSTWAPEERKRQVLETGVLPTNLPAPGELLPPPDPELDLDAEVERLRDAVAHFQASPTGPVAPHRIFGPLTRDEWTRLQCIHCAHHLGFLVPETPA